MVNEKKVAIVGCGFVGSSSAFALMQSGLFSEMVLIDVDKNRAEGEALDIAHGMTFAEPMKIYAGDYSDVADAAMIVVTAGAAQKPGETRLDLVNKNVNIFKSIIPEIKKSGFDGILLIVSNPVDVLTYAAIKMSGLPEGHVIGSGTVLDTGRLQQMLGAHVEVDPRDVQAYVMGEHGDSEFVAWSSAQVAGVPLSTFCELHGHLEHEAAEKRIAEDVKNSAYTIIEKKHATYYGVAMAVKRICTAVMRDEQTVLPVSSLMVGEYGLSDLAISMPTVVGRDGVVCRVPVPQFFRSPMAAIAGMNAPLAMIVLGVYLAQTDLKAIFTRPRLYALSAVRLVVIPLLTIACLLLLPAGWKKIGAVLVIVNAAPIGSNIAVYAQRLGLDSAYAVQMVCLSTLLSLVTLPVVLSLAAMVGFA